MRKRCGARVGSIGQCCQATKCGHQQNAAQAYEAYRKAYLFDLNHYWSGLAALQQGTITLELSIEETWQDTFDNVDQVLAYRAELKR